MERMPSTSASVPLRIVAVHGGAGFHSPSPTSDSEVKRALRLACTRASATLHRGEPSLLAVVQAISILEDSECFNAGYGSNLTVGGTVECDASLMDGQTGDFGAVGAVSAVQNPIKLAFSVLQHSRLPDPLGRIPPLMLVSSGAHEFAHSRGMTCTPESLISPRAKHEWEKWKAALEGAQQPHAHSVAEASRCIPLPPRIDGLYDRQDTVGAIAIDDRGNLAAGVSSGGLLLKHAGRVGEAAVFGAGCWATKSVACSVSGAGEYIIRMSLAKTLCDTIEAAGEDRDIHGLLSGILGEQFRALCGVRRETSPQAGILFMVKEHGDDGQLRPRLWCAFTTESMAVGYVSTLSNKPSVMILRRPARPSADGASLYIAALPLKHY